MYGSTYSSLLTANKHVEKLHTNNIGNYSDEIVNTGHIASTSKINGKTFLNISCNVFYGANKCFLLPVTLRNELISMKEDSNNTTEKKKFWLYNQVHSLDYVPHVKCSESFFGR